MGGLEAALLTNFFLVSLWASRTGPSAEKGGAQRAQCLSPVPLTLLGPFGQCLLGALHTPDAYTQMQLCS